MSNDLRLEFEENPAQSDEAFVKEQLGLWNVRVTGFKDYAPAYFFLRDGQNKVHGGLLSYVWGKWLHVDVFWLEEDARRQGWGTKMLEAAHAIGREKGAEAAWLDTFDWQARPFYERLGYEVVFEQQDIPAGHTRYYMCKRPL
jgi:ribosomal protein S18 acetylase RimI-like enzyme